MPYSSLLWKNVDEQYSTQSAIQNSTSAGIIEFDRYMREPHISRHEDPLKWWKMHKDIYPRLFIMVKKGCACLQHQYHASDFSVKQAWS